MKILVGLLALLGHKTFGKIITDEDIEELNRLIPNGEWQAGRVFASTEDALPLLGSLPDTRRRNEKEYKIESLESYQGRCLNMNVAGLNSSK